MDETDYGDDLDAPAPANFEDRLTNLIHDLLVARERLAAAVAAVTELRKEVAGYEERDLPALLGELRLTEARTQDGARVAIKKTIHASMPARRRASRYAAAITWLEEVAPAIIKRTVEVNIGRGKEASTLADRVEEAAHNVKEDLEVHHKVDVNAQTLSAWVRERRKAGGDVPDNTIQVYERTIAEVELP